MSAWWLLLIVPGSIYVTLRLWVSIGLLCNILENCHDRRLLPWNLDAWVMEPIGTLRWYLSRRMSSPAQVRGSSGEEE